MRVEFAGIIADLAKSGLRLLMGLHHVANQPMPSDPNAPDVSRSILSSRRLLGLYLQKRVVGAISQRLWCVRAKQPRGVEHTCRV